MTVTALPAASNVEVTGDAIRIRDLVVRHAEAASLVRGHSAEHGPQAVSDLLARAIPVGLVALSMSDARLDSSALQRTLDAFAHEVDQRSSQALTGLDDLLGRLQSGEEQLEQAARTALEQLPARLDRALAGEADTVRSAVTVAAREVHAAALDELRRALNLHASSIRSAVSLDGDGPVQTLRQDVLAQLDATRRELAEQLATVREMLAAADAGKTAATKSSRAIGADFEAYANAMAEAIVVAAGDRWEDTGAHPAGGTTRRVGDGVCTLSSLVTGRTPARIVIEAKHRSRPLTVKTWRDTLAEARSNRAATGALAIVPNADQVPGNGGICRVDEMAFVVAADHHVDVVYHVLRELVAIATVGRQDAEIDLGRVEAQLQLALGGLTDLDELGRLVNAASKNLATAREVGGRVKTRIHEALTAGLAALHP
jgi:hypothetical protein